MVFPPCSSNGLSAAGLWPPERGAIQAFRIRMRGCTVLSKVGRWDPDKHWLLTIHIIQMLKQHGWQL
jgi:hypothetical protein